MAIVRLWASRRGHPRGRPKWSPKKAAMTRLGARPRPPIVHIGSYTSRTSRPPRKFRRCEGSARRRAARPAAPRVAPLAGPERRRCLLRARSRRGVVVALSRSRRGAAPEWNRGAGQVVRLKRGEGRFPHSQGSKSQFETEGRTQSCRNMPRDRARSRRSFAAIAAPRILARQPCARHAKRPWAAPAPKQRARTDAVGTAPSDAS